MIYLWLKALHVAAVIAFAGGMLAVSVFLSSLSSAEGPQRERRAVEVVRKWDRLVTTPAMLLTWALGLALALEGGWFSSSWLPIKLAFVVALSGLHGVQSGRLRRIAGGAGPVPITVPLRSGPLILVMVTIIALLVVTKPF